MQTDQLELMRKGQLELMQTDQPELMQTDQKKLMKVTPGSWKKYISLFSPVPVPLPLWMTVPSITRATRAPDLDPRMGIGIICRIRIDSAQN
jgi:hypothetical protein